MKKRDSSTPMKQREYIAPAAIRGKRVLRRQEKIRLEICFELPSVFSRANRKLIDTAGRVERFQKKYGLKN